MPTLYWSRGSVALAPHIVLEEIGEPYRTERVEIDQRGRGEMLVPPEYLKVNPKGRVPALVLEDGVLTEAPAIMVYLARKHPQAGLLPKDALAEARCLEWMNWVATTIHAVAFSQIVRPQRFVAEEADYPAVVARGRQNVGAAYAYIEEQLQGREWAVEGGYSIVDPYLLFFYLASKNAGNPMGERFPAWTAVAERVLARPATQRVLERQAAPA